jgi:adiponectin receptor
MTAKKTLTKKSPLRASAATGDARPAASASPSRAIAAHTSGCCRPNAGDYTLRRYEEAPAHITTNPYILTGYRVGYTPWMCARSLFMVHNQTGNVWSHLLGFLAICVLAYHVYTTVLSNAWTHQLVFAIYIFGNFCCLCFSTVYHLMSCCVNKRLYEWTMFLDYFGIAVLVTTSFIPLVFFVFQCYPFERMLYLGMVAVLGGATLTLPWFPFFDSPEWAFGRIAVFFALGFSGLFPITHATYMFPKSMTLGMVHVGLGLMCLLYSTGVIFYVTKFPECWFPGRFDIWFQSHTVWHCFVVAAAIVHFFTCIGAYQRFGMMDVC